MLGERKGLVSCRILGCESVGASGTVVNLIPCSVLWDPIELNSILGPSGLDENRIRSRCFENRHELDSILGARCSDQ